MSTYSEYENALSWLTSQLPFFQKQGSVAYKPGLERSLALMKWLDHPEKKFPCVHVGGTNGKGSTSHLIAAALQTKGLKTGLYTSPHLYDFRERIRINGKKIRKGYVVNFVEKFRTEALQIEPSFFELTMAMAFSYFTDEKVDIAVIEVGMGGRLDSTNVVTPLVSVITNIGWDHMQYLGDSLPKIAYEKAGIIKTAIPVVIGEKQAEVIEVFESVAKSRSSQLVYASEKYAALDLDCELKGTYQKKNVKTAYAALQLLPESLRPTDVEIREAFRNVKRLTGIRGRWEVLMTAPLVIADTAHNFDGIAVAMQQLNEVKRGKLFFVWGMVNDKDAVKIFTLLPRDAFYIFCKPDVPRAMPMEQLQMIADKINLTYECYDDVPTAFRRAIEMSSKKDTVYVGGSTFVVGDLLKYVNNG